VHGIQVLICCVVVEEKVRGEGAGNRHCAWAAKPIPFAADQNAVDFGGDVPSWPEVVEATANLDVGLLQCPRRHRRRLRPSCP
jgi:hypothetical protein